MTLPLTQVIIPFRDRGTDPLRAANLSTVLGHWEETFGITPMVIGDGRTGKELFNRSAAYNLGVQKSDPDTEVFIFAESDMICPPEQIFEAITLADVHLGLVVPFTTYCYHGPEGSKRIRAGEDPAAFKPTWVMTNAKSVGAINVVARRTIDCIGQWDEKFEGNWYDDDAMELAFSVCGGQMTRFIDGQAHHLYHLPGHRGKHLTDAEKIATKRNQSRLGHYERAAATNNVALMRRLLKGEV